jgi:hypothetical protein
MMSSSEVKIVAEMINNRKTGLLVNIFPSFDEGGFAGCFSIFSCCLIIEIEQPILFCNKSNNFFKAIWGVTITEGHIDLKWKSLRGKF